MFFEIARIARDWGVILLAVEGVLLAIVPLVVLYRLNRGLRQFLPKVRPALRQAQQWLIGFKGGVEQVMASITAPFIWTRTTLESCNRVLNRFSTLLPRR